jgi:Glycosyltransferase family 87
MLLSVAVLAGAMLAGPSGLVAGWGHGGPFLTHAHPMSRATVTLIARAAAACGGLGTAAVLVALRRGWTGVAPHLLVAGGVAAAVLLAVLPPAGSVDILNYAEYGRIADLGFDPYSMTPQRLGALGDPVGVLHPRAWARQPAVYGPVATDVQAAAAWLGGASLGWIVFWLKAFNAAAFVATGAMLDRLAGTDRRARIRAAVLWTANPLMLFWMVGSGHADVLAVLFVTGAVFGLSRMPAGARADLVAGVLAGAAISVKVTYAIPVAGLAAAFLRRPRVLAGATVGAAVLVAVAYLSAGRSALSSFSQRVTHNGDLFLPVPPALQTHATLYGACVLAVTGLVGALLWWRFSAGSARLPEAPRHIDVRPAAALAIASVVVSPVQYPWYDAVFLPLLALLPPTRFDEALTARLAILTCVLLPGIGTASVQYDHARVAVVVLSAVLVLLWVVPASVMGVRSGPEGRPAARTVP